MENEKPETTNSEIVLKSEDYISVGKLIQYLNQFPPEMPVVTTGYESGFENIYEPVVIKVRHEPENLYYDGEFQAAEAGDTRTLQVVAIKRVVRDD